MQWPPEAAWIFTFLTKFGTWDKRILISVEILKPECLYVSVICEVRRSNFTNPAIIELKLHDQNQRSNIKFEFNVSNMSLKRVNYWLSWGHEDTSEILTILGSDWTEAIIAKKPFYLGLAREITRHAKRSS